MQFFVTFNPSLDDVDICYQFSLDVFPKKYTTIDQEGALVEEEQLDFVPSNLSLKEDLFERSFIFSQTLSISQTPDLRKSELRTPKK